MDPSNNTKSLSNFHLWDGSSCTDLPNLESPVCLNPSGMPATFNSCPTFNGVNGVNEVNGVNCVNGINGHLDLSDTSSVSSDEDGIVMKMPKKKVLTPEMVNEGIKIMSYAVRGPLMIRANELEKQVAEVG